MTFLVNDSSQELWYDVIKAAETSCAIKLNREIENYLVTLLIKYTNQPELTHRLFAKRFLEALQSQSTDRFNELRSVGDECLLFAGLYPRAAAHKLVKINYFVDLGRSAYTQLSEHISVNDLFRRLAYQFIALMDVLQSIRSDHDLLPLEAYEQWKELGSKRALQILQRYTDGHRSR